ncbi:DUF4031 domain-containing protein [Sulfitobacter pontiacus]|uniref:DUF4031 domain-containing protein n=1 Tax=Sulfitobacter pontiacus TaxID=60137 RepID=UPI002AC9DD7A|nr:DUF4031 domain-containing protein [Sulfitobacter pontiacus]WPZ24895.1 DUF4031 domain-containing protein [Sulfitobacter pontiacus]
MTVYVDNMQAPLGRMKMCHMVADTSEELLAMADKIGVQRKWLQKAGTHHEHFDIALTKRKRAVEAGAKEVTRLELGKIIRAKRDKV